MDAGELPFPAPLHHLPHPGMEVRAALVKPLQHLEQLGISCRQRLVPGLSLYQLFLDDPDGVVIELNYPAHEKAALDASLQGH